MADYFCRRCRRWLIESEETRGKARVKCKCGESQWVYFGGFQPRDEAEDRPTLAEPTDVTQNRT